MIKIFRCSYCEFESEDEQETIDHEKTHRRTIDCDKIQKKDYVPCTMGVLEKNGLVELTFTWIANVTDKESPRTLSNVYSVDKKKLTDSLYVTKTDGTAELVDDMREIK